MKHRYIQPRSPIQSALFAIFVSASLGFLVLHAPVSEGAEFDLTSVRNEKATCGSDTRFCDEGYFETDSRDRAGLRRDTGYFLGYQVMAIGILYAMPESVSGWSSEQKEGYSMSIWWDNVTHPQMDSDDFYINYILHPYWGGAYFVRARERGYNDMESFWYAVLLSSAYEFGVEALFEEPSIQDLFVTPVAGSMVGMYFMNVRDNIREREIALGHRTTKDKWLWVLTDPLGSLNRQVDKLFGRQTDLQIRPYSFVRSRDPTAPSGQTPQDDERVYGIEFRLRW
ncbi:MAG: DUF3943 domain-containing protein [Gammaproteobacteria bacterium]|nr:DUF3943 domain-containing protein [Gammaproteobacteria bacterium]MDH5262005.1 DUF3943 domain-containing protein [Gammaproteobacteria bacterium]